MLYNLFYAASMFLQLMSTAIFIYCILTWILPRSNIRYWMERFISPFTNPFRPLCQKIAMKLGIPIDFSCWFAMIAIQILNQALWWLYRLIA